MATLASPLAPAATVLPSLLTATEKPDARDLPRNHDDSTICAKTIRINASTHQLVALNEGHHRPLAPP
jgi:hypothetical protein